VSPFVTLEGPEGSGKTTQVALLREALQARGIEAVYTREPGGTPIGEAVRNLLHDVHYGNMAPETEILLYSASRAQHVVEVIRPALQRGALVVCDRFSDATLAYQGYGRGLDLDRLDDITQFATGGLQPDLVLLLDLEVDIGLARKEQDHRSGHGEWNRMDRESLAFHRRVRQGYLELAQRGGPRWRVVDASMPVQDVHQKILEHILTLLSTK